MSKDADKQSTETLSLVYHNDTSHIYLREKYIDYENETDTLLIINNSLRKKEEYSYKKHGIHRFLISKITFNENWSINEIVSYSDNPYKITTYSRKYNKNGDLISTKHIEKQPSSETQHIYYYTYLKFDRYGNWIEREMKLEPKGEREIFTQRKITYYD